MGAFLDKPLIERAEHREGTEKLDAAMTSIQGWRVHQEDAHIVRNGLGEHMEDVSLFAVFDGHGGKAMSEAVSAEFVGAVRDGLQKRATAKGADTLEADVEALKATLPESFVTLDKALHARVAEGKLEESGTTAVCVFVTPTHILCANTGDSRAVYVSKGVTKPLSFDHKPSNAGERERIYAAGGVVSMERVDGDLAVSRAFGDFRYKENSSIQWEQQKVSVVPEIITFPRDPEGDQYIVVACDGIWDVMSNEEVGNVALRLGEAGATPDAISEFLVDECLRRNSRDNMSVITIKMEAGPKPDKARLDGYQARREVANRARKALADEGEPLEAVSKYITEVLEWTKSVGSVVELKSEDEEDEEDEEDGPAAPSGGASSSSSSSTSSAEGPSAPTAPTSSAAAEL